MRTFALIALTAAAGALLCAAPQDKSGIKMIPPSNTSASSGAEMFNTYCAVCHGKSGKGDGPAAASLKATPGDLTQIAKQNQGKFPDLKVRQAISLDVHIGAHGDREMPIWGPVFKSMDGGDSVWRLRVQNLTDYLHSIQAK
jgi:mono/diheme cytochrome c family protein